MSVAEFESWSDVSWGSVAITAAASYGGTVRDDFKENPLSWLGVSCLDCVERGQRIEMNESRCTGCFHIPMSHSFVLCRLTDVGVDSVRGYLATKTCPDSIVQTHATIIWSTR